MLNCTSKIYPVHNDYAKAFSAILEGVRFIARGSPFSSWWEIA